MKKALIKRADTRLVACEAASSFSCVHLSRVGQVGTGQARISMQSVFLNIVRLDVNRLVNFSQECQASEKYFLIAKCLYMAST